MFLRHCLQFLRYCLQSVGAPICLYDIACRRAICSYGIAKGFSGAEPPKICYRIRRNPQRGKVLYWQPTGPNPLNHRDDFSGPALRHGSLNSLFQVTLYLPS